MTKLQMEVAKKVSDQMDALGDYFAGISDKCPRTSDHYGRNEYGMCEYCAAAGGEGHYPRCGALAEYHSALAFALKLFFLK